MSAVRGAQTFLTYCAPRPLQVGVARALDEGDAWLEASRRLYGAAARAAATALGVPAPSAGTFLFFDASRYVAEGAASGDAFLEACADEGVILTPGSVAGADYARWARLCFTAVPPEELDRALTVLAALASEHDGR
jgi:N-succinyldiaminopimelate aminotransferase